MSKRLLISGGRNTRLSPEGRLYVINLINKEKFTECLNGGATGIDFDVRKICEEMNVRVEIFYPQWEKLGKKAGPIRNLEMIQKLSTGDLIVLFNGNAGTNSVFELSRNCPASLVDLRSRLDLIK